MSALEVFKASGAVQVTPDILIDAGVPLSLSGEAVRGRICTFTDAAGHEWALRPDLTLPVALSEIATRRAAPVRAHASCYDGPVFRLPASPADPVEYEQIGVEQFGYPSNVAADCDFVELIAQACQAEGLSGVNMRCGDLSVFPAFVDALGLAKPVASALKRAYRQAGGVRAYLAGRNRPGEPKGLSARLQGMSRGDVESLVADIYALTGLQPLGQRSADEIIEGLVGKHADTEQSGLSEAMAQHLLSFLAIDVPLQEAPAQLKAFADECTCPKLTECLNVFEERCRQLLKSESRRFIQDARFATRFGRRFTYYDGFMFEFSARDSALSSGLPIAAGGRYDSLLDKLSGGEVSATAIGGILIPHRLHAAAGGGA